MKMQNTISFFDYAQVYLAFPAKNVRFLPQTRHGRSFHRGRPPNIWEGGTPDPPFCCGVWNTGGVSPPKCMCFLRQ